MVLTGESVEVKHYLSLLLGRHENTLSFHTFLIFGILGVHVGQANFTLYLVWLSLVEYLSKDHFLCSFLFFLFLSVNFLLSGRSSAFLNSIFNPHLTVFWLENDLTRMQILTRRQVRDLLLIDAVLRHQCQDSRVQLTLDLLQVFKDWPLP